MKEKYEIKKTLFDIEIESVRETEETGSVDIWIKDKSGKIIKHLSVMETPKDNRVWISHTDKLIDKKQEE